MLLECGTLVCVMYTVCLAWLMHLQQTAKTEVRPSQRDKGLLGQI